MVVVGLVIRQRLDETPEFQKEQVEENPSPPLAVLFRYHWRGVLRVFFAAFVATVNTMFAVFALNFATSEDFGIEIDDSTMLWLAIVANIVAVAVIPFWAIASDRIGRKPVFVTGLIGSGVLVVGFLGAIAAGEVALMFVLGVLLAGIVYSMPNAVWPATYAEYFPTRTRLSGMAIGTQFGFALAGFTPTIAGALMGGDADNWWRVAAFTCAACAISAVAVLTGPRATHRLPTSEVGGHSRASAGHRLRVRGRDRMTRSVLLGLVGDGVTASLTPALQEREGARVRPRPGSTARSTPPGSGWGRTTCPTVLDWAERLGFDGLNVTHPFKQEVLPLLDDALRRRRRPGRGQHRGLARRSAGRPQHRLVGVRAGLPRRAARAPSTTVRWCSARAARAPRSATACWSRARPTSPCSTSTATGPRRAPSGWPSGSATSGSTWPPTSPARSTTPTAW